MLIPAKQDLTAVKGVYFDLPFQLWQDVGHTVPYPLTGYTVELQIDNLAVLSVANGNLIVDVPNGVITPNLSDTVTKKAPTQTKYRLKITDNVGKPNYLIHGIIHWSAP